MFRGERRPLKPNWWTILPLLANVALWAGIVGAGAWIKTTWDEKGKTAIYAAVSSEAEASSRKPPGRTDCPRPGCAAGPAPGAATPSR